MVRCRLAPGNTFATYFQHQMVDIVRHDAGQGVDKREQFPALLSVYIGLTKFVAELEPSRAVDA